MARVKFEFSRFDNLFMAFPSKSLKQKRNHHRNTAPHNNSPIYLIFKNVSIFSFFVIFSQVESTPHETFVSYQSQKIRLAQKNDPACPAQDRPGGNIPANHL